MPICKYCHHSISKFDKDICPYCGGDNPIDANYKTKDMTSFVNPVDPGYKLYKSKSRRLAGCFCLFGGVFSLHRFYLGFWKSASLELLANAAVYGLLFLLFYFVLPPSLALLGGALFPFLILFVFYALSSLRYFLKDSLKDAHGEFLR